MKKYLFILAAAIGINASAQSTRTIKGAVIDKNGNPLPGATVEAEGGSEVTTVDADGTFTLEVPIWLKKAKAQYAGMQPKTLKVGLGDMIFTMKPENKRQWYLIANYGHLTKIDEYSGNTGGLMFGRLGKWGWYLKANVGKYTGDVDSYSYNYNWNYGGYYSYAGTYEEDGVWGGINIGISKRIIKPLHAYVGVGVYAAPYIYQEIDYPQYTYLENSCFIGPEIGLVGVLFKHLALNISYNPLIEIAPDDCCNVYGRTCNHYFNIGVGYAF